MRRKDDWPGLIWFLVLIGLLVVCALWSAYNLLREDEDGRVPRVSVIVENSSSDRWTAFRLGVDQAAAEYGVDVTFTASGVFDSPADQEGLVRQELAGNPDALILALCDSENTNILKEGTAGGRSAVLVETDGIRESSLAAAVIPSGIELGQRLGQMLLEAGPDRPSAAVLAGNMATYVEAEMVRSFTETLEAAGGSVRIMDVHQEQVLEAAFGEDFVAVFGDELLLETALWAQALGKEPGKLYGVGCSPSNISLLDRGVVSGMVIPDEFAMGYQSLALLARRLSNDLAEMKDVEIGCVCVRSEEVHEPSNEKLLFPLVQ